MMYWYYAVMFMLIGVIIGVLIMFFIADNGKPNPSAGGLLDYQFQQFLKKEYVRPNVHHVTSEDINKYFRDDFRTEDL